MNRFTLIFVGLIILLSCRTPSTSIQLKSNKLNPVIVKNDCPENGICTLELLANRSFKIEQGTFGKSYPKLGEGTHFILKFTYKKNPTPAIADSGYTEIIYADLGENIDPIYLKDKMLRNVNLVFGRLCFCGDQSGYFPVHKGSFSIVKVSPNILQIDLQFSAGKIPQIITQFSEQLYLN